MYTKPMIARENQMPFPPATLRRALVGLVTALAWSVQPVTSFLPLALRPLQKSAVGHQMQRKDFTRTFVATLDVENHTLTSLAPQVYCSGSSTSSSNRHHLETPLHNFASIQDCLEFLDHNANDESSIVVKYYASYCRICARASINYKKLACDKAYENEFDFTRVEVGRLSPERLKALGISKFPFIQIFRKGMCVASFSTGASHLFARRVRDTLDLCKARSSADWDAFEREFQPQILDNVRARTKVLEEMRLTTSGSSSPSSSSSSASHHP